MKHNLWHRFLAAVMAGVLCCSMLPVSAFAAELPEASSTAVIEQTVEDAPGETEDAELPDTTAPPAEEPAQTTEAAPDNKEIATPETGVSVAQAFIDAVNALDREAILAKMNAWALPIRHGSKAPTVRSQTPRWNRQSLNPMKRPPRCMLQTICTMRSLMMRKLTVL